MQRMLAGTASCLENQRHKNMALANDIVFKQNHIKELSEVVQKTNGRLKRVTDRTVSAAERVQHLEEMIQVWKKLEYPHIGAKFDSDCGVCVNEICLLLPYSTLVVKGKLLFGTYKNVHCNCRF